MSIDSNSVTSVHGRKNAITGLLQSAVTEEANGQVGVFYWNKKEASKLMTSQGVTMPQGLSLADGFIHSIREICSPVNINVKKIAKIKQIKCVYTCCFKDASKITNKKALCLQLKQ